MKKINPKESFKKSINLEKDSRPIIESYFNSSPNILIRHQLESYDNFMEKHILKIISQSNPLVVYHQFNEKCNRYKYEIQLRFKNPNFTEPIITENDGSKKLMFPNEARLRNFTYSTSLYIDIETVYEKDE